MILFNTGTSDVYFGASGLANTTGGVIWSGTSFTFENVKDNFIVYLICASGGSSTLQKVEF